MKRLHSLRMAIWEIIPLGLLAVLQACANPLACPGEPGAPMDQWGNEVNVDGSGNHDQRLNTDCYYGRGDNGKIVLLTQKPQTGFWNSSLFRTDETTPLNTHNAENSQYEAIPNSAHNSVENDYNSNYNSAERESMVTPDADPEPSYRASVPVSDPPPPAPEPIPASDSMFASEPVPAAQPMPVPTKLPANQALYYRAGKVKGECGTMNVYREANVPPCPLPPPPPAPPPVQRTYIQNNYPPVVVQTGEPPAQAAGAFLGGIGEDVMGAGVLTYAIRYRPDQITNNSYSNSSALSHAREVDPGHGPHFHHPEPHGFEAHHPLEPRGFDPHHHPQQFEAHHHPEPHRFDAGHHPEPREFDAQHHPQPKQFDAQHQNSKGGDHEDLMGMLNK